MCNKISVNSYAGEYISAKDFKKKGDLYIKFESFDDDYIRFVVDKIEQLVESHEVALSKSMLRTDLETSSAVYFELKELFKKKDSIINIFNFVNNFLDYNDFIEFNYDNDLSKVNEETTLEYLEENFMMFDFLKDYCERVSFVIESEDIYNMVKEKYVIEFNKFKYKKLISSICKEKRVYVEERDYIY